MSLFDTVRIRDAIREGMQIPSSNNFYNSEPWYLFSKNHLLPILKRMYGSRELFDEFILDDSGHLKSYTDINADVQEYIDDIFRINSWKYARLYDVYIADYNPIWNVDGTETETINRTTDNTGTQTVAGSGSDTLTKSGKEKIDHKGDDTLAFNGSEKTERTGNETDSPTGTSTLTKSGAITEIHDGDNTHSRTTFDSSSFLNTDKDADSRKISTNYSMNISGGASPYQEINSFDTRTDTHTYNQVADEKTFNQRNDKTTYNSYDETSFTNRQDQTTYGKTDTRTDNLTETESISTMKVRQGNIGVTSTQKLIMEQVNVAQSYRFLQVIAEDIAQTISYN